MGTLGGGREDVLEWCSGEGPGQEGAGGPLLG